MPYKSDAQRKFFHTDTARKQGITPEMVSEYDQASKGMSLPEHANRKQEYMMRKRRRKRTKAM